MPIRAVLFDFDGTLADSYPAITASVNFVRKQHGLPPLAIAEVRQHVGRGLPYLLEHCVPAPDLERDAHLYREHHPTVLESGTRLLPGARETLESLRGRGLKTAICSNKPVAFTRSLVRILAIAEFVDEALGPEDVAKPKPAPDILLEALKRLRIGADEALYVGDMNVDIQTARAAGVPVWVVPTGSSPRAELEAAKPDRLLSSLTEVVEELN